jgi:hypothetical protein
MQNFLKRALILDAVAVPMMLVYWWLKGPHTVVHLSNCLVIGGGILLIIGFLFYGGGRAASGDFPLQYARTVSAMDLAERQQQEWTDHVKGYLNRPLLDRWRHLLCNGNHRPYQGRVTVGRPIARPGLGTAAPLGLSRAT